MFWKQITNTVFILSFFFFTIIFFYNHLDKVWIPIVLCDKRIWISLNRVSPSGIQFLILKVLQVPLSFITYMYMCLSQNINLTIFTSHGIVILYLYTIPWQKSLSKSRAWRCSWSKIVIVWQPIWTIFSIWVQWMYIFHFPFQRRTCFFTQWSIICDWFHIMPVEQLTGSPTFSSDFCQGIVSRYDITIPWPVKIQSN